MLKFVFEAEKGLSAIAWLTQIIPKLNKKKYVVEIKEFRNKRSLRANAYAWELIDKLAEKLKIAPTDIYRRLIRSIGGVSTVVSVYDIAADRLMQNWSEKGLGWQAETLGIHDGMRDIVLYYGSSTYDTAQMSRFIDLVVQECEQQGIETLTPAELELMKGSWQCGAIIQEEKECFLCGGTVNLDSHHVFGGSRRRLSEKYGLKVWLCHDTCHIYGKYAVHKNRAVDTNIKEIAQRKAMDKYGWDEPKFINLFGKNYL